MDASPEQIADSIEHTRLAVQVLLDTQVKLIELGMLSDVILDGISSGLVQLTALLLGVDPENTIPWLAEVTKTHHLRVEEATIKITADMINMEVESFLKNPE